MNKIFSNKATHSFTCPKCGDKIRQVSCEEWANVPDNEIDFAIEDNAKMEEEWMDNWMIRTEQFMNVHTNKCDVTYF